MATSYHQLGILAQARGDYDKAEARYQQSLTISEELGNRAGMANSYGQLGILAQDRGDYDEAERRYQQSLTIDEELGNRAGMATSYSQIGILYSMTGRVADAVPLHCQALAIRLAIGIPQAGIDLRELSKLRTSLGASTFTETASVALDERSIARMNEILDQFEASNTPSSTEP